VVYYERLPSIMFEHYITAVFVRESKLESIENCEISPVYNILVVYLLEYGSKQQQFNYLFTFFGEAMRNFHHCPNWASRKKKSFSSAPFSNTDNKKNQCFLRSKPEYKRYF